MSRPTPRTPAQVNNPPLLIHVFGEGKGESIVLRLPDGCWGVVDCYSRDLDDPDRNPVVQFLKRPENHVRELAFLCLTHPHDDHYRGMSHLLKQFRVHQFWRFAVSTDHLKSILKRERVAAESRPRPEDRESLDDLVETIRLAAQLHQSKKIRILRPNVTQPVYQSCLPGPVDLRIVAAAPSHCVRETYAAAIEGGADGRLRHNDISLALLITYGQSCVLLGGDVEAPNWREVLRENVSPSDFIQFEPAAAIKVCHHGSANGCHPELWESLSKGRRKPVAVIAPFRRFGLPSPDGLALIRRFTNQIYVTNRNALPASKKGQYKFYPDVMPGRQRIIRQLRGRDLKNMQPNCDVGCCTLNIDAAGTCQVQYDPPAVKLRGRAQTISSTL
jgi:beta-lactamase superfamily II metal-dependent hydrolase